MAEALQRQAESAARTPLARGLALVTGSDPLAAGARAAYSAALGARGVGRHLERLPTGLHLDQRAGSGPARWHVLHSVPLPGPSGQTLDHVVVGPCGVVVVRPVHLPGARVRTRRGVLVADGQRLPALADAHRDADRLRAHLQEHLALPRTSVTGVVAVVGAERLTAGRRDPVPVVSAARLVAWLRRRPAVLTADAVEAVAAHLRSLTDDEASATTPPAGPPTTPTPAGTDPRVPFERLRSRVRSADQVRRAWQVVLAVGASAGVVVALLDLLG